MIRPHDAIRSKTRRSLPLQLDGQNAAKTQLSGLSFGGFMFKVASAVLLCVLAGCASTAPVGYSVCSTQPGSYACQIEQYQRVND